MQKISWQLLIVYTIWLSTVFPGAPALAAPGSARQVVHAQHSGTHREWAPTGRLAATNQLNFAIALPLRNTVSLTNLLHEIYNPASTNYHRYLTPAQFAAQFGPSAADYAAVQAFARAQGWHIAATHPNRLLLDVSGAVPDVERALHVHMQTYQHPTEPRRFFAPDAEPSLDLATPILGISGLDNFARPQPHVATQTLITNLNNAVPNAGSGPNGSFLGDDFRSAYLPNVTLTGTGQTVGLLQFDGYTPADITYYASKTGRAAVPLRNVLLDGFTGTPTGNGGEVEVALDIEMALSMAPGLSQIIVYMAGPSGNWHDILNRMATDNLARQLSCSWYIPGGAADPIADIIFQQMALQGQTFFTASGDYDAYTGPINFPNASPYITQVGGTTLTTTGTNGARVSETTWNRNNGIGTGGGIATEYPIPSWQTNVDMSRNQGSTTWRNIPDVALTAENVYVRANLQDYRVGGTSCASPLWAAVAALVNQQAAAVGQPPIGFINPALDAIGTGPSYSLAFNDITTGNNASPISPARFSATNGYDLCTGWGTPNGQNLINALANPEPLLISPLAGFSAAGAAGGPFTTAAQTFTLTNGGTNSLTWSLANTSLWLSASATSGTLLPGGPAATVTMSLNAAASNLVVGLYPATLWFTNGTDASGQSRAFNLSVIPPPVIVTPLTNVIALAGSTAVFNLNVTGGQPLACQWQFNGSNLTDLGTISGTTTTNLVLASIQPSQAGNYSVIITNAAGAVTSAPALLTIPASAPVLVLQPTNQTLFVHQTAQFAVTVVGSTPYTYQWTCNTTNLPGATNATLTLGNLQLAQSGNYAVQVSNAYGSTNSTYAVLTVNPLPPCAPESSAMVSWWSGEGDANDTVGLNNGSLVGGVSYAPGEVGQAFSINGGGYVSIPDSVSLDRLTNNFTVEAWIKVNQFSSQDWIAIVSKGDTSWQLRRYGTTSSLEFWANGLSVPELSGSRNVNDGLWHHAAAVYDGTHTYLYIDGTLDISQKTTGSMVANTSSLLIGNCPGNMQRSFNGLVDEISIYNRALSAVDVQAIYLAGIGGKCPIPLTITTQPNDEKVDTGNSAVLTVAASGKGPLNYQWTFNGTSLAGATNSTLLIPSAQVTDAGVYAVIVSNNYDSVVSSNAVLTVLTQPPFITTQPASQTNFVGYSASFTVAASGSQPLSYQWTFNTTNLVGATNATLSLTNLQLVQSGAYAVQVSNAYGLTNSANALLTVTAVPPCTPAPSGLADWWTAESNANDSVGLNNGTLVGGVTYAPGEVGQAFQFDGSSGYVNIPDSSSLDSIVTNITIELWLKINQTTVNPNWSGIVAKGNSSWRLEGTEGTNTLTFTGPNITLTGTRNVNDRQWHHVANVYDGTNMFIYVDGTLDASTPASGLIPQNNYPVTLGAISGAGYYLNGLVDEISLFNRALTASDVQLIYEAGSSGKCSIPSTITSQPASQIINAGNPVYFAVVAAGMQPLNYQWTFNGTNILGATNSTLKFQSVQPANGGIYSVTVTNFLSSVTSSNALLTVVTQPPVITSQPLSQTNFAGKSASFSVTASGSPPLIYQWSFNATNLTGATNATLILTNLQITQSGNYAVQIANAYGSTNSAIVQLTVNPLPTCAPESIGMMSWWAAEGNANDTVGFNNGSLVGSVGYGPGEVGQAYSINNGNYVSIPDSKSIDALTNKFTVETWIKVTQFSSQNWVAIVSKGDTSWQLRRYGTTSRLEFWANGLNNPELIGNRIITNGIWHHVAAVYDGTHTYLYIDGTLDVSQTATGSIAVNSNPLLIGNCPGNTQRYFNGFVDEVSIYNRTLSALDVQTIYLAGNNGKCPISPTPPTILSQPTNLIVIANSTATFSVLANGTTPLYYQWNFNGTNLPDATNSSLVMTNVQISQSGKYAAQVSNAYGITNSLAAVLTVNPPPPCDPISSGLVSWWPGEGNANDSLGNNNGTFAGNTSYLPGEVGQSFSLDGSSYVNIPDSPSLDSLSNSITVEAWIRVNQFSSQDWIGIVSKGDTSWQLRRYGASSSLEFWANGLSNPELIGTRNVNDGKWHHVAAVYDGSRSYLYIDGAIDVSQAANGAIVANNNPLIFGDNPEVLQRYFNGFIDEVSVYNKALSPAEIQAIYTAGSSGKCPPNPPYIATQPVNQYVIAGANATFSVLATGTSPLNYDWKFNGTDLVGATNATLTITNVQANQAGIYEVVVTNTYGSITSSNATLSVLLPPTLALQPFNLTNLAGTTAIFYAAAIGGQPLSYHWQKNGFDLTNGGNFSGVTTTNLALANLQDSDAGVYSIVVTNLAGSITSSPALLVVVDQPSILAQPTSQTTTLTSNATFMVVATGTPPLTYLWNFNGTNFMVGTSASLTFTNLQLAQAGNYTVLVTNLYGGILSSAAALVVNPLYDFVWNPIPNPRFASTPFAVVIQAETLTNGVATNFNGTVALVTTNGLPVIPAISGNFVQGVWTGAVTITKLTTNLVLQATDNLGDFGLANPINIVNLPTLTTVGSSGTLLLLWPTSPAGFLVETAPDLTLSNWLQITMPPFQIGNQNILPIQTSGTNAFYRLRFPGP